MTNTITIDGRLGGDPKLSYTKTGRAVLAFSLAHTPRTKVDGEWEDGETMWIKVESWGGKAEQAADDPGIKKGGLVSVCGRLSVETWESRDGQPRSRPKITADTVAVIHTRRAENGPSTRAGAGPIPREYANPWGATDAPF